MEGTTFLTKDEFPRLMLGRLKVEAPGVVVERPEKEGGFTNSAVIPLFAGQRMWLGWYGHELLWREFREDVRKRHESLMRLFDGEMPGAGKWLVAQGIDYVLWYREGDTPELWRKVNDSVGPEYVWCDILTYQDEREDGRPCRAMEAGPWAARAVILTARVPELLEHVERRADHLVHVEIAVLRQASDEGDAGLALGELPVPPRKRVTLRAGDGIVWVALAGPVLRGELAHQVRRAAHLAGDVFQLHGPREGFGPGIVDLEDGLDEASGGNAPLVQLLQGVARGAVGKGPNRQSKYSSSGPE